MLARTQLVAMALVGVWIGISLFMWFAAGASFSTVERILRPGNAQFAAATQPLTQDQRRVILRYLASEINRSYFRAYGWAQVALGALLFLLLWRQTLRDTIALTIIGTMLGLVLILTLFLTPQIVSLGRSMDFVPRHPPPPGMQRFWMLHAAFTGLDGVKVLAGLVLLCRWILAR